MRKSWIVVAGVAFAICFSAGVVLSRSASRSATRPELVRPPLSSPTIPSLIDPDGDAVDMSRYGFAPRQMTLEGERYVVRYDDGAKATLTLDPVIQSHMESLFRRFDVPVGALVAIAPKTGRVLAYVSYSQEGELDTAASAEAPSASIFKMVTATALIEEHGFTATTETCYRPHGGEINQYALTVKPGGDGKCETLGESFGRSSNLVFARHGYSTLDTPTLSRWAARYGYDSELPFPLRISPSHVDIPQDAVERGKTAAGFWNTHLSPMQGALMAATVANGGVSMRPKIIDSVVDADGAPVYSMAPQPHTLVMKESTARTMGDLMVHTTTVGTARRYFSTLNSPDFMVAGKTGTLARKSPYRLYTWFVGFAPVHDPEIAVAALVGNPVKWKLKGALAGAEAMRAFKRSERQAAQAPSPAPEAKAAKVGQPDSPEAEPAPAAGGGKFDLVPTKSIYKPKDTAAPEAKP